MPSFLKAVTCSTFVSFTQLHHPSFMSAPHAPLPSLRAGICRLGYFCRSTRVCVCMVQLCQLWWMLQAFEVYLWLQAACMCVTEEVCMYVHCFSACVCLCWHGRGENMFLVHVCVGCVWTAFSPLFGSRLKHPVQSDGGHVCWYQCRSKSTTVC